jgi:CelD/BcsL family acetyltransferase involved in cellulose biosynthesis
MDATVHEGDVESLLGDWAEVFAADDRATPFQSPAWASAWWRHWGDGSRPWSLTVREGGRVVGIAAMRRRRVLGVRTLNVSDEPGDYWDLVAVPEARGDVEAMLGEELRRRAREWDAVVVARLPSGSSTAAAMERAGLRPVRRWQTPCPGMPLPDSFDAYLSTLPTSRRTNVRRRLKNLDGGELALRVVAPAELPEAVARWQTLRMRQWQALGKRLMTEHTQARFRAFLVDVTSQLVPAGLALMWEFVREDQVVGSFINLCDERAFYQYLGAYEPELGRLAIGKVATAEAIRTSIAAGRSYYDFGRGVEEYKYWFGAADRPSVTTVLADGRTRSRVAARMLALRRAG